MTFMLWRKDGEQFFDENGNALAAGSLEYKLATTETNLSIYSDPLGATPLANPVVLDAAGKITLPIYVGEQAFKERGKKSGGTVVFENDGYLGSPAAAVTQEYSKANQAVMPVSSSRSITSTDYGGILVCDPTGGDITLTLPPASGVTNGRGFKAVHVGASGKVILQRSSTDLVGGLAGVVLHGYGDTVEAICDTTAWRIAAASDGTPRLGRGVHLAVKSRAIATAPVSPVQGARYILPGNGIGVWNGFLANSVAEYTGITWANFTPVDGWYADIEAEDLLCRFNGTSWIPWTNVLAPASSNAAVAVFQDSNPSGTAAQTPVAATWNISRLNTQLTLPVPIVGAALATNVMTIPTGKYQVAAWRSMRITSVLTGRARLISVTDAAKVFYSSVQTVSAAAGAGNHVQTIFADVEVTAATEDFRLEFYAPDTSPAGAAASLATINEVYAAVHWYSTASLQGPIGLSGPQGVAGPTGATGPNTGYDYSFDTGTADANPGAGVIRFNNASPVLATFAYISKTNRNGVDLATRLLEWGASTTASAKAIMRLLKTTDATVLATAVVSGAVVDAVGYVKVPLSNITMAGTLSAGNILAISLDRTGDQGATGPNTGLDYAFDTGTTDANPGSGKVRVNNAAWGSATFAYISKTGRNGEALGTVIANRFLSTTTLRAHLRIFPTADRSKYLEADVSAALTDGTTYWKIPVSSVQASAAMPAANDVLAVMIEATGSAGATGPNVGLDYAWNTATSGDPGSGNVLVNNATPASATVLHISETNRFSAAQGPQIATWDDSTNVPDRGTIRILDVAAPGTNFLEYSVTGTMTDAGAYDTFPVAYIGGAGTIANAAVVAVVFLRAGNAGNSSTIQGLNNRVINPSGAIAQQGVASTANAAYTGIDQWLALTQTGAVTPSQLTAVEDGMYYAMRITQAQAAAQRYGYIQPLELSNIANLRGQTVGLSARARISATTTIRYAIVAWTGTADALTKNVVNDWTSAIYTTGNFFIATTTTIVATGSLALTANTLTSLPRISGVLPSGTTNVSVFFWTDSTQAQNVTFDLGNVDFSLGAAAPAVAEYRPITLELDMCLRYWWLAGTLIGAWGATSTTASIVAQLPVQMRVAPTIALVNGSVNGGSALEITVAQRTISAATTPLSTAGGGRFDVTTAAAGLTRTCIVEAGAISFNARL